MLEQKSLFDEREGLLLRLQNYKLDKISHSKIAAYQSCPFYYYLQYVRKVIVPKAVHFSFGQAIHHKFDEFYELRYQSADSFANTWSRYWPGVVSGDFLKDKERKNLVVTPHERVNSVTGETHAVRIGSHIRMYGNPVNKFFQYLSQGKRLLRDFYNENIDKARPILREKRFDFIFSHKNGKEYLMTAVLDRIDKTPEGLILSDYKSDRLLPFEAELDSKNQFTIYYLGFKVLFGKYPDKMFYNHLLTGKALPLKREERHIDSLEAICEQLTTVVRNLDFSPKSRKNCGICDFHYDSVCDNHLKEYMELMEELNKRKLIMPQGVQWRSLLTDQQWEEPEKKKPLGKRRFKGETEEQHALFTRKIRLPNPPEGSS
jgi:hypothetical protein